MKKFLLSFVTVATVLMLCSCSQRPKVQTETRDNLQITYVYNNTNLVISKNIYDAKTGCTTEYFYLYKNESGITHLVGVNVVTIAKDGQIIDSFYGCK